MEKSNNKSYPQLIDLKVGPLCNNKCIHCAASNDYTKDLSTSQIYEIINSYIEQFGIIDLTLTGGEITIRDDYPEIMQFIAHKKSKGEVCNIHLQTNGRMFSKDSCLQTGLDIIDYYLIALHSCLEKEHNLITGNQISYKETITGLKQLVKKVDIKSIAIQTVINKVNIYNLKNTYQYIYTRFGIKEFNLTFPHPMASAFNIKVTPKYSEVINSVNDTLQYCLKNNIFPLIEALPLCVFKDPLRPYVYKIYEERKLDVVGYTNELGGHIDYKIALLCSYKKYKSCNKCCYYSICNGVWKEYIQLYPNDSLVELL